MFGLITKLLKHGNHNQKDHAGKRGSGKESGDKFTTRVESEDKYTNRFYVEKNGKQIGEIHFYPETNNQMHIDFMGIDKSERGAGRSVQMLLAFSEMISKKYPSVDTFSADLVWIGSYKAMRRAFGQPESIGDDIRNYSEQEVEDYLPKGQVESEDGTIDAERHLSANFKKPRKLRSAVASKIFG